MSWRRMAKADILVLTKTFSEDPWLRWIYLSWSRHLEDVSWRWRRKTSSSRQIFAGCQRLSFSQKSWLSELLNLFKGTTHNFSRHTQKCLRDWSAHFSFQCYYNFATGICPIEYVKVYGLRDEQETAMMDSRWRIFEFSHQIRNNDIKDILPCSKCFYDLVMLGSAT